MTYKGLKTHLTSPQRGGGNCNPSHQLSPSIYKVLKKVRYKVKHEQHKENSGLIGPGRIPARDPGRIRDEITDHR